MKAQKGTVTVNVLRGRLRLQLPRQLYGGVQKYFSLGIPDSDRNRKFAELKAKQIEVDILSGVFDPTLTKYKTQVSQPEEKLPHILLDKLWEKFTQFKKATISQSTLATDYEKTRHMIECLPSQKLTDAVRIRDFLLSDHKPKEARRYLVRLSACCEWAVKSELTLVNPFKGMAQDIKIRQVKPKIDSFTAGERDRIIEAFQESSDYCHYANFVGFLFYTGCRPSEAIALEWRHISVRFINFEQAATESMNGISIKAGLKTQSSRQFPINDQVRALLDKIELVSPPKLFGKNSVFPSPNGALIDFHNFRNRAWATILRGLPDIKYLKPYSTRATFITLCLEAGIDAKDIASWVGNSADVIYKHYAAARTSLSPPNL